MVYEIELKEHHLKARRAFDLPAEILGQTDGDTAVICIDLQAALLTPKVTAGMTYYKRKLSTLNIGIHDYRTRRGHMFVRDEVSQLVPHAEQVKYWNAILNAPTASRDESDDNDDNDNTAAFDNDYEYC